MKNHQFGTIVLSGLLLATSAPLAVADVGVIHEAQILLPNDGAAHEWFGNSVAHVGSTVLVGSRFDEILGASTGSAYLMNAETGAQIAKLIPSDLEASDDIAISVGMSGNIAIVGSWSDNTVNGMNSGSAYLFDATTGQELFKLLATDGSAGDHAGFSVAISGEVAIVGAKDDNDNGSQSGSAYLFDVTTGVQIAKLLPTDGEAMNWFGSSVAISGTTAIVGAYRDNDNGGDSGSAYLFDVTTGDQIAKLLPSDGAADDRFGRSVAINGTAALVAANGDDDNGSGSGSAYLFDITTGIQLAKLLPSDGAEGDSFGSSVAISETMAVIGASGDNDNGPFSGSAYVFHIATGTELVKLRTSYNNSTAQLGTSVSISGTTVVAGARGDDDNGMDSGSAFVFDLQPNPPGTPYCFGDGTGAACPCGNTGGPGEGCANSTGVGAKLAGVSTNSVSDGAFALFTSGLPAGPGLYFQADNKPNSGDGVPFGDGLRCAGGNVIRLEVRLSTQGISRTTVPIATIGEVSAGDTKHYQLWYRDTNNSPCGSDFNLSNGYEVLWMP